MKKAVGDCEYLSTDHHNELTARYEEIGMMSHSMMERPESFVPGVRKAA